MVVVQYGHTLAVEHGTLILRIFSLLSKTTPGPLSICSAATVANAWLGVLPSLQQMLTALFMRRPDMPPPALDYGRLKAWAAMRFTAASSFCGR